MLNNKWIISNKEQVTSRPEYLYTLILVDGNPNLYKTECQHICSKLNLNIGNFVDCDLKPLSNHYKSEHTDIATVEFTNTYNIGSPELRKFSFFSSSIGCFDALITKSIQEFPVRRGDNVSVFMRKDPLNPLNINKSPDYFVFKMMKNLTTDQKSPYFEEIIDNYDGVFEDLVVVGVDPAGINETPAKKYLFLKSNKFGYSGSVIPSDEYLFFTRPNDKLLIERDPNDGTFEILRNITADNIRTEFILNQR